MTQNEQQDAVAALLARGPVVLRVPLVIAGPGVPQGRRDGLVGLTDIAHTALTWAKLPPLPSAAQSLDLLAGEDPSRALWAAESGLCDPECTPGCNPTGFLGKDRVVYGAQGGLYVVRPGFGEYGERDLAPGLESYDLPLPPPGSPDGDQARALGYQDP